MVVQQSDLSTLFELLPIGAYRLAMDGTLLRVNAALLKLNGFDSEIELRVAYGDVIPNPYLDPGRRDLFRSLLQQQGHVQNFESEMARYKTGERMWVREHSHLVRDAQGNALYYEGTVEDITEERNAKSKLEQSENLLTNLLATIPDHVWLKDLDGVYITCNSAFAGSMGVTVSQVVGTRDVDWVDEESAAQYLRTDRMAMAAGKPVVMEEDFGNPLLPFTALHEIMKTPLHDSNGKMIGILGMAHNIQHRKDAEQQLRDTTEQLELALMGADLGRWSHNLLQEKGYRMDERACAMLGRDSGEYNKPRAWGHLVHPDDLPDTLQALQAHVHGTTEAYEAEYRARHADGRWMWLSSRGKVVQVGQNGSPIRMAGTLMDVSERKYAETQLRTTQAELQATLNALPDLLMEYSAEGRYRAVHSHNASDLICPAEIQMGKLISEVLPGEAADVCQSALQEARETGQSFGKQYSLELAKGTQWFELSVVRKPTDPGEEERFIAIARNITERKDAERAIQHMAFHDSLTGLPNRRMLTDRLHSAVLGSYRKQTRGALLFLDLDRFKELNDNYGHDVGDLLLQEVARRLLQCIRAIDTVARLGGDEFVVLVQDLTNDAEGAHMHASSVGLKILDSLNDPYALNGELHTITPSIGVTLFLGKSVSPETLLKQADLAMYKAKDKGRNTLCFYSTD